MKQENETRKLRFVVKGLTVIFGYTYLNILVLFRLLNKEHQMIFWYKNYKKIYSDILKTLKNKTVSGNPLP